MAENKKGTYKIISLPFIYNTVQFVAGGNLYRDRMVKEFIKPFEGARILDIGCGTGEYAKFIQKHCKNFEYYGFDGEESYIEWGKNKFKNSKNIHLFHTILTEEMLKEYENFDTVIAIGIMHHLDDPIVKSLLEIAKKALKPDGKLITFDPGKFDKMNLIENFFYKYDRGRSIRTENEYENLVKEVFKNYKVQSPYMTYYHTRNVIFECFND